MDSNVVALKTPACPNKPPKRRLRSKCAISKPNQEEKRKGRRSRPPSLPDGLQKPREWITVSRFRRWAAAPRMDQGGQVPGVGMPGDWVGRGLTATGYGSIG